MRVFCPNCSEPINIADDLAGKTTTCPQCSKPFTAPSLFSSTAPTPMPVAPAASEPVLAPVAPSPAPMPMSFTSTPPAPAASSPPLPTPTLPTPTPLIGRSRSLGFSISPEVLQWVAPAALAMCVLMTFFSWNGAYPGGHAVYTQGPWRALVGSMWTDPVGDEVLGLNPVKAPEGRTRLEDDVRPNYLMLLFLPLLFGATALAFFFTLMPQLPVRVPPQFAYLVPWRMVAVAALALLVTGLLAIQALRGFGLENAIIGKARAHAKEATKLPDRPSDEQIKKAEISEGEDLGRYNVRVTCALRIEFACLILAIIGALLTFVMTRRTDRPAPRFEFVW